MAAFDSTLFSGLYEPLSGLNKMDFELHGIYMDHEPEKEFVTPLNKCKDSVNICGAQDCLSKRALVERGDTPTYIATYRSCSHRCGIH